MYLKFIIQTEAINSNLQHAGEIGHQLSNNMTEKKVIDDFVEKVSGLFNVEYAYLFDHQDGWLELIRSYENGEFIDVNLSQLSLGRELRERCLCGISRLSIQIGKSGKMFRTRLRTGQNAKCSLFADFT